MTGYAWLFAVWMAYAGHADPRSLERLVQDKSPGSIEWSVAQAFSILSGLGMGIALTVAAYMIGSITGYAWELLGMKPIDERALRDRAARLYSEAELRLQLSVPLAVILAIVGAEWSIGWWQVLLAAVLALLALHGRALWKEASRTPLRADLSETDLSFAFLRGANCAHVDFSRANLQGAVFTGALFLQTQINGARLMGASMERVDLSQLIGLTDGQVRQIGRIQHSSWRDATLSRLDLSNVHFVDVDFSGSDLSDSNLSGSKLQSCLFTGTEATNCSFVSSSLAGTTFCRTNLSNSTFSEADLSGVTFDSIKCTDVEIRNSYSLPNSRVDFSSKPPFILRARRYIRRPFWYAAIAFTIRAALEGGGSPIRLPPYGAIIEGGLFMALCGASIFLIFARRSANVVDLSRAVTYSLPTGFSKVPSTFAYWAKRYKSAMEVEGRLPLSEQLGFTPYSASPSLDLDIIRDRAADRFIRLSATLLGWSAFGRVTEPPDYGAKFGLYVIGFLALPLSLVYAARLASNPFPPTRSHVSFLGCSIERLTISKCELPFALLQSSRLDDSSIRDSSLHRATLMWTSLRRTKLSDTKFGGSRILWTTFAGSSLRNVDLTHCRMTSVQFNHYNVNEVTEQPDGGRWSREVTRRDDSTFINVDFSHGAITTADFDNCDLRLARFYDCRILECDFSNSNLSGTSFDFAKFGRTPFAAASSMSKANLSDASFRSADLSSMDFSEAHLHETSVEDYHWRPGEAPTWPPAFAGQVGESA